MGCTLVPRYKTAANTSVVKEAMKVSIISILVILPVLSIAHTEKPILNEWTNLKKDGYKHLFSNNYDKTIESSKKLLVIDPSDDESSFLFLFTYI